MNQDLTTLFVSSFVTFFVLIDAIGVAPVFAVLTSEGSASYRRTMALKATIVASLIIFAFAFGGAWLLTSMGISIDAFRAAGGLLLFMIALEMVFEKRTERRRSHAEEFLAEENRPADPDDISVFPIGIPMIAGPGTIAMAMLSMSRASGWPEKGVILAALGSNLVIVLGILMLAGPLMRAMGESVAGAITRIMGVILAALSVQLLIDGIKGAFGL
ncbi:MAG: multiple antibiotic resistance protein [Chlamydiales bacterium]|jgi:multiple antibiotic resistance protein